MLPLKCSFDKLIHACKHPMTPGTAPRTPPSLQLVTADGGGGSGYKQRYVGPPLKLYTVNCPEISDWKNFFYGQSSPSHLKAEPETSGRLERTQASLRRYRVATLSVQSNTRSYWQMIARAVDEVRAMLYGTTYLRKAEFWERKIGKEGGVGGGQPDLKSIIQKYICSHKYSSE